MVALRGFCLRLPSTVGPILGPLFRAGNLYQSRSAARRDVYYFATINRRLQRRPWDGDGFRRLCLCAISGGVDHCSDSTNFSIVISVYFGDGENFPEATIAISTSFGAVLLLVHVGSGLSPASPVRIDIWLYSPRATMRPPNTRASLQPQSPLHTMRAAPLPTCDTAEVSISRYVSPLRLFQDFCVMLGSILLATTCTGTS